MPGYEDEFYRKENIIGYTGALDENPTVYFRNGKTFGRITQDHSNPKNIGRNKIRLKEDYSITNDGNEGKAIEIYDGAVKHRSRNAFVTIEGNEDALPILEIAIEQFPNIKPKYC